MDIIFSVLLTALAIGAFFLVDAQSPGATPTELGAAFWPQIILGLLIVLLIVNIVKSLKDMKNDGKSITSGINVKEFFTSKLFIGMVMVAVMAAAMSKIGFLPSCLFFLIAYGALLGEKRWKMLIPVSIIVTIILYIIFQGALDIMLARGVGPFRDFALMIEMLLPF